MDIGVEGLADLEALLESARRKLQDFEDGVDRARLIDRLREGAPAHPILLARTAFALLAGLLSVAALVSFLLPFINRDIARIVARIDQAVVFKPEGTPGLPLLLLLVAACMLFAYMMATFAALQFAHDMPMMAWEARQHQKLVNEITRLQTQKAVMARIQRSPRGRTPLPTATRERFDATPAGVVRSRSAQQSSAMASRAAGPVMGTSALFRASTGAPAWPRADQPVSVARAGSTAPIGLVPRAEPAPAPQPRSALAAGLGGGPVGRPAEAAFRAAAPAFSGLGAVRNAPVVAPKSSVASPIGVLGARTARVPITSTGPGGRPAYAATPGSRVDEAIRSAGPGSDTTPIPEEDERIQVARRATATQGAPAGMLAGLAATGQRPATAPLGGQSRPGSPMLGQALRTGRSLAASAVVAPSPVAPPPAASEADDEDVGDLPTALRVSILSLRKRADGPSAPVPDIVEDSSYISGRSTDARARQTPKWGAIDEPWLEEAIMRAEKLAGQLPNPIRLLFSPEDDMPFALVLTGAGPAQAVRAMIQYVDLLRSMPTPARARIEMGASESLGRNVTRALEPYFHDGVSVHVASGRADLTFKAPDPGWSAYRRLPIVA
jgi:hypothetical protein